MLTKAIDLQGRVAHDPILRKTKTGKSVCTFAIAMDYYSDSNSNSYVSYIDIETWDKLAELCASKLTKGKYIQATGRLKQDRWQDNEGKTRSKIKLVSSKVVFIDYINRAEKNIENSKAN